MRKRQQNKRKKMLENICKFGDEKELISSNMTFGQDSNYIVESKYVIQRRLI